MKLTHPHLTGRLVPGNGASVKQDFTATFETKSYYECRVPPFLNDFISERC